MMQHPAILQYCRMLQLLERERGADGAVASETSKEGILQDACTENYTIVDQKPLAQQMKFEGKQLMQ